jgi:hypothetical protein
MVFSVLFFLLICSELVNFWDISFSWVLDRFGSDISSFVLFTILFEYQGKIKISTEFVKNYDDNHYH